MTLLIRFLQLVKRFNLCIYFLAFTVVANFVEAAAHGQLSSLSTQVPMRGGSLVKMDTVDDLVNMDLSPSRDAVIVKEDGLYFIMSAAQIGATGTGASGYVDIWLNLNGQPLTNSTSRMTIQDSAWTAVVVEQTTMRLKAGDAISTSFASSGPSLGLVFMQPDNEAAIPSIIFSIFKIR